MAQAYLPREASEGLLTGLSISAAAKSILVLLIIVFFVVVSLYKQSAPAAVSASAPPGVFSSGRAMKQLEVISQKPHPVGSAEHSVVRDYLLKELAASGLKPEVQTTTSVNQYWQGAVRAGSVDNIIAKLNGTEPTKAVLLVAHYDSMPTAFGASDDGAGVVTLLETLRALKAGEPLRNDVIFLFSDGEEVGLLGARAFVDEHPLARDVGVVLNFEARGNGGPSIMFETSDKNGWLIKEFARAAPHPIAHSLAYEVYRLLPNDTDMTVFKSAGFSGLNFAYINGLSHYHTLLDSFDRIEEDSLQHQGSYALSLARHLGNLDMQTTRETNAIYFDIWGSAFIHYSNIWALPLAVLVTALFAALVVVGLRRRRLTLSGMGFGFLGFLSAITVAVLTSFLLWKIISKFHRVSGIKPRSETYYSNLYLISFLLVTVAVISLLYIWLRKKISVENLTVAALFCWIILMILTALYLPGASYLFTWPLLFSLAGLWIMLSEKEHWTFSLKRAVLITFCAVPGIVLFAPVIYQVFIGLTLNWIGPLTLLPVLLLGLLLPQLKLLAEPNKWLLPSASALIGLCLIAVGISTSKLTVDQPSLNSIFYGLDADTGKAIWGSVDRKPDEWTSQFLSANPQDSPLPQFFNSGASDPLMIHEAPPVLLAAPVITLTLDESRDSIRTLRLHVTSARRASVASIYLDSQAEVTGASINGKPIEAKRSRASSGENQWSLRYYAMPADGIDLAVNIRSTGPVKLRVVDQSYGLEIRGVSFQPRQPYMIPAPVPYNDSILVSKSYTF